MARLFQKTLVVVFVGLLCLPATVLLFGPRQTVSMQEKRTLAAPPTWPIDLEEGQTFPSRFESFFNDHFGFREQLLRLNNYFKVFVLRTSPVYEVVIGRDGWLYFNFRKKIVNDFLGLAGYTKPELFQTLSIIHNQFKFCRDFNSRFLFVLAPNKQSIYPEYLPSYISRAHGVTRADQLMAGLAARNVAPYWDLRPVLLEAKKSSPPLYLTKDSHWTQRGAFLAYQSIIGQLREWYPPLPLVREEQLDISYRPSHRGDLADLLGMKAIMPEETCFLKMKKAAASDDEELVLYLKKFDNRYSVKYRRPIAKSNPNGLLDVVLFRDSFSTDMIPYFAESFRRLVVFYEPFNIDLLEDLKTNGHYHPDLVINERIEYSL